MTRTPSLLSNNRQRSKAKTGEAAFQQMEEQIASIHYFFSHADLSEDVRQVMTYRKLMALDYFTPQAAQALLRQWIQADPGSTSSSSRTTVSDQIPTSRSQPAASSGLKSGSGSGATRNGGSSNSPTTRSNQLRSTPCSRLNSDSSHHSGLSSETSQSMTGRNTVQDINPLQVNALAAQLNAAVAQQQWEQAIQIIDKMLPLSPNQAAELSTYRGNLIALISYA